ncbi:retrotransposon protein, putative, ty1-copia subclass, partial [Tanacetum coccineum]
MTTTSANNSDFRGFFEKQKLNGPNFIDWYQQLRIVLSIDDKLNYLEQPLPPEPVAPEGQLVAPEITATHIAWIKGSKNIVGLMLMTIEPEIQQNLENLHAYEMLQELKTLCYPRDNIFEIDLSNHNTNNSSMYDVSNKRAKLDLDSALLWHCRLGHISKKRIEKLQHDGLLNSTDLRAFEKCVPCMSGKMARKPYTHQVERAKDLLGLIHTDVCGPFKIMSRQGTSYFVTFTDDFSRYGYVYLLKHKHEVFETFKVFQKEVENQLGYPKEIMRYSFYYPPENKVLVAQNTKFLKNSLINQEASGSLEDLEIIQEEDTHPSIDTSLNHEDDDLEIDEPQSDIIPIHRSIRIRRPANRICLYIDAEEHELGDLGEPANYKAALLDPEFDKWLNAMNVEIQSMKDNEVWDLVELPPNGKTVGSKSLFKKKTNMDEVVHTYKACLVAKGYTQTPGIDYEETFSPVVDIRAIRILIVIAAFYDYKIWIMDVKTVFLNGYLFEEVYMEQPK